MHESIAELYQWRNGTRLSKSRILNDHYFLPGYYLLSIDEAIHHVEIRKDGSSWGRNWFPFMASGGGDFMVVNCAKNSQRDGFVINYIRGEPEHPVSYLNVPKMILTIAECHEEGAYFVNKDGFLKVDFAVEANISGKLNPGLSRWR